MTRIFVFGDSIAYGYYDIEGGWTERLKKFFIEKVISDENYDYSVYNMSISGDCTRDVLERFEFEMKQRTKDEEGEIIIFAIGANDTQILNKNEKTIVSPVELENNIKKLIFLSRKFSNKILFVGLTPVDDERMTPVPWRTDISYNNKYIESYNEIIKNTCKENKVPFIDFFKSWFKSNYKDLLEDGAHPNTEGHKKIFETIKDYLEENNFTI